MARKRYIETHSNYTLKRLHQATSKGDVYESDLMTITELGGFAPGQAPIYSHGNFKLSVRNGVNNKFKHENGSWLINTNGDKPTTIWSPNCLGELSATTSTVNHIKLNPDYTDLLEFAYFGSASELIRASLSDIILHFPGEIYLTQEHYSIFKSDNSGEKINLGGDNLYIVHNPFKINLISKTMPKVATNTLRYFSESWTEYEFLPTIEPIYCPGQELGEDLRWYVKEYKKTYCAEDGDLIAIVKLGVCNIYFYFYKGELIALHDYKGTAHIRPKSKYIEDFFNALDEFEKNLLNRRTNYTSRLRTPRETDTGIYVSLESYQWPIEDGWNLDFSSPAYQRFVGRLMDVAEIYDKYYSDNVVRSMTHEALKNFDWTHTRYREDETTVYEDPNSYKMEGVLRTYGRHLDNIKLYIKNIKYANTLTYNGLGNTPDYFIKKQLELDGWEVKNPLSGASDIYAVSPLYPSDALGYSIDDANNTFLKILKLSTNAIMNAKGTKRGIEMLLALFGYHSIDFLQKRLYSNGKHWNNLTDVEQRRMYNTMFRFNEYVGVAYNKNDRYAIGYERCDNLITRRVNARKDGFEIPLGDANSIDEVELQGLPVKPVTVGLSDGREITYLVPWFDANASYDTYFQAKGGWGKKEVKHDTIPTYGEIEITSDENFTIYEETNKYLHFALNVAELLQTPYSVLENGDIYYVSDISDASQLYEGTESVESQLNNGSSISVESVNSNTSLSHYFVLVNKENCNCFGKNDSGEWGWKNISHSEIVKQQTKDAKSVYYLESIKNDKTGNNPHIGYGRYDDGAEYLEHFDNIFKNATFNGANDSYLDGYGTIGFDVEVQKDNTKCWYFTDTTTENNTLFELNEVDANGFETMPMEEATFDDTARLRPVETRLGYLVPFNMEGGGVYYDEAAANSIINLKKFELDFFPAVAYKGGQYDFISEVVMFYVKQLIPSTAILRYNVPDSWSKTAELCNTCEDPAISETVTVNNVEIKDGGYRNDGVSSEYAMIGLDADGKWYVDVESEEYIDDDETQIAIDTFKNIAVIAESEEDSVISIPVDSEGTWTVASWEDIEDDEDDATAMLTSTFNESTSSIKVDSTDNWYVGDYFDQEYIDDEEDD